jgi:hypothetical protein
MRIVFPVLMVLMVGGALAGQVMERCAIAHLEGTDPGTCYPLLSAVPALYFHHGGESYGAPLLTDGSDSNSAYYVLSDWADYLNMVGSGGSLIYLGDVDPDFKTMIELLVPAVETMEYAGTDFQVARDLAMTEWPATGSAVVAPHVDAPAGDLMESAAAAAGWAANNNCPLLWTATGGLSAEAEEAITGMGVSEVWVVDYADTLSAQVYDDLSGLGVSVTQMSDPSDLLPATVLLTGDAVACMYKDDLQALSAAIGAARYGGYVLQLPEGLLASSRLAMEDLRAVLPMGNTKLDAPVTGMRASGSEDLAEDFYNLLDSLGGAASNELEVALTFNSQTTFPATFERSINGDPSDPSRDGAVPGRFPLDWIGNLGTVNRGALHEAVLHANPRPDHVTISMNAYEVGYPPDYMFDDNWYNGLVVNEVFGWPEEGWTEENNYFPGWPPSQPGLDPLWPGTSDAGDTGCCPGQYATFYGEGYETHFHSGAEPGVGTHPSQPDVALCGFVQDVIQGSMFLYFSCHGGGTMIAVRDIDNGVAQDDYSCEFGDPWWPDPDARVYDGSAGGSFTQDDLDGAFDNLHSLIIAYNACSMANGEMNEVALDHGAIGSIGSLASVSFDGSGWWWNLFVHLVTAEDFTVGEALTYANARISDIYTPPGYTAGVDASLQYVLYGDPMATFPDPGAEPPVPAERHTAYGTHYPDGYPEGVGAGNAGVTSLSVAVRSPARSQLSCRVSTPTSGHLELALYDLLGRRVRVLEVDVMPAGRHSRNYALQTIPAGVYFLRVSAADTAATAKIVVLR